MAKEIIKIKPQLTFFDSWSARAAANQIEAVGEGNDLHITLKSYGGGLWDGWESVKALQNFKGHSLVDVPGVSASFGLIFMVFADERICSNQAKFMFHAVGGGSEKVNKESKKELYDILAKVINLDKFKEITGKTLKEVLIPADGERVDVWLNAKEAKEIELIHKIYKLDPLERVAAEADVIGYYQFVEYKESTNNENNGVKTPIINNKISKMNKEQFKAENPAVYNEIYGAGRAEGEPVGASVNQARIDAFMEFHEIDPEMVLAKIKDPKATVDAVFLKEITAKAKANALAGNVEKDSEKDLDTGLPKNEAKKEAGKVDLTVIPEDVKEEAVAKMKGLNMNEVEINAELVIMANEYAPKTKE